MKAIKRVTIASRWIYALAPLLAESSALAQPALVWLHESAYSHFAAADQTGGVYVAGRHSLARYSGAGSILWERELELENFGFYQGIWGVSADTLGNVFLTGSLWGPAGNGDVFVAKFDSEGNYAWAQEFSTNDWEHFGGVAADGYGSVLVTGSSDGNLGSQTRAGDDAFVSKHDAEGNLVWIRQFGGPGNEGGSAVSMDAMGNGYVAGSVESSFGGPTAGRFDAFLRKYDPDGRVEWTRQLGTEHDDEATAVAVDKLGNAFVTGVTETSPDPRVGYAFLSKYDATGDLQWSGDLIETRETWSYSAAVDSLGSVLIAGGIGGYAGDLFDEGDTADAFVRKYDAAGNLLWTWEWATEVGEVASSISTDGLGNIFVSGQSFHGYWFALLREPIPGDYNGSGTVEQADLDLVLLNWGKDRSSPPAGWTASLPIGAIDQQELDAVLLNWGNAAGAVSIAAIPEPSGTLLALVCLACIGGVWAGGSVSCKKA